MFLMKMPYHFYRMPKQHARTGHAHHLFNHQSHIILVAMDGAGGTSRLLLTKRTSFQTLQGIRTQRFTVVTQLLTGSVFQTTIDCNHLADDSFFSFVHTLSFNRSVKLAIFFLLAKQNHLISFFSSALLFIFPILKMHRAHLSEYTRFSFLDIG